MSGSTRLRAKWRTSEPSVPLGKQIAPVPVVDDREFDDASRDLGCRGDHISAHRSIARPLPEAHEMIVRRLIVEMIAIIPTSTAPCEENCVSQIMYLCEFDLISRQ